MEGPPASTPLHILVVDDEVNIRKTLAIGLESHGHRVVAVSNATDAAAEAARQSFDLAFVDQRLGAALGLDLIPGLLSQSPWMRIVIITAHGSIHHAVEAMKRGASDYLTKPFTPSQVALVTRRVSQLRALEQKVAGLESLSGGGDARISLESSCPAMRRAMSLARQVARADTTVLLRGESGTGKTVLAHAIHSWSGRAERLFSTLSCPSLSAQLLESELFGHAKGAFTGAVRDNPGRIAASEGGTLFLDEIGDLPIDLQPKLLRFLQERRYERVGESSTRQADVRIITATHIDLETRARRGCFREDLLYRINVMQIELPPLRERAEDILPFARSMLADLSRGKGIVGFTPQAEDALRAYPWPGNLRELRNVVERAVILCQGEQVGTEHLPQGTPRSPQEVKLGDPVPLEKIEELHIRRVLAASKSLEGAANALGIDLATLWRRRKKYEI